jgi:hypothetical protein
MPLLSPSPPNLTAGGIDFTLLPPASAIFQNFPHALVPFFQQLLEPLTHVAPALALSALFFSSTIYTEAITKSKYPEGYKAYQERVGMFGVVYTFEKGLLLAWKGRKEEIEALVWGKGKKSGKVE